MCTQVKIDGPGWARNRPVTGSEPVITSLLRTRYDRPVKIMVPLQVFKPGNVDILRDQKTGPCPTGPYGPVNFYLCSITFTVIVHIFWHSPAYRICAGRRGRRSQSDICCFLSSARPRHRRTSSLRPFSSEGCPKRR